VSNFDVADFGSATELTEADIERICAALWQYLDDDMLDTAKREIVETINLLRAAKWVEVGL
jgi:hypothetical protein